MEKFISKDTTTQYITTPNTGNTLARQDDRRKEVPASIETDFEIINEGSQ